MHSLRRSDRVEFKGSEDRLLAGIVDQPVDEPRGFVLVAHCFTCSKDLKAIVRISRRLAEHGWGVLRFDFSGLGNSQGDFAQTNFSSNLEDLRAAAAFLADRYTPPKLLFGHSFGGAAAMACANDLPSVLGVACLAAPSDTQHLAALLAARDPNIELLGEGKVNIGGYEFPIHRQMLDDFRRHDLPERISHLTKPVLLFHSPEDETVGYHHAMRIFSLVTHRGPSHPPSPGCSLITLPHSDHLLLKNPADLPFLTAILHHWLLRL